MAQIIYSWKIVPNLPVIYNEGSLQNVVNEIVWTYQGDYTADGDTSPTVSQGIRGSTKLTTPDINTFIPFESLTEEIVKNWLDTTVDANIINDMQYRLSQSIAFTVAPTQGIVQAPWV